MLNRYTYPLTLMMEKREMGMTRRIKLVHVIVSLNRPDAVGQVEVVEVVTFNDSIFCVCRIDRNRRNCL